MSSTCPTCGGTDYRRNARTNLDGHPTVESFRCNECGEKWMEGEYTGEQRIVEQ